MGIKPRGIIGTMEVDLERGIELVCFTPDMMVFVVDFYNHIQIVIEIKDMKNGLKGNQTSYSEYR